MNNTGNGVTKLGFYHGYNRTVAQVPKLLVIALVVWASSKPEQASQSLSTIQSWTIANFGSWYMLSAAVFMLSMLVIALIPASGRIRLSKNSEAPEFSRFSWFAMMFGAGVGIGMLTYSTAEPIFHFSTNPETLAGLAEPESQGNVRNAYKWGLFHWALTPWGIYAVLGISLAYFSYHKGQPLTLRSALRPILGNSVDGLLGNVVDIIAIVATVIGVAVTIGFGVSQFASGVFNITGANWILNDAGAPTLTAQLIALGVVIIASTISALSGVSRGIKWLSNINMGLTAFLLLFFVFFGAFSFAASAFGWAIWDYLFNLFSMSFTIWNTDQAPELAKWQADWTLFYWAWWIAFAPFVGLFLARVSKGRSIREYVLGAMVVPSLTCLTWFALIGGTALELELSGAANGSILRADISAQLYQTINLILSPSLATGMSVVIVVLLLTYLVTSVDSAILVVTNLASEGKKTDNSAKHIVVWAGLFSSVIAALLYAGGMPSLRSAMIIGALPFSFVMALILVSLILSLVKNKSG